MEDQPLKARKMLVIFSDLDRCLLGADYRFDTVQKTVQELLKRGNLLIINSSKTRLEIDVIQKRMGFSSPFIVENGSAIFIPDGFLRSKPPFPQRDGYFYLELGNRYDHIKKGMEIVQNHIGMVTSFSSLSTGELAELTGLSSEDARLAKTREYSEPFIYQEQIPEKLIQKLAELNFRIIKGRNFCHLTGPTDKGQATERLIGILKTSGLSFLSCGIGDGPDDLPMLRSVDIPLLTQLGPEGWRTFVGEIMETHYG